MLGISVSPAPRKAPAATIDTANNGSANASIRNTRAPSSRIEASGVSKENINGAPKNINAPVQDMTAAPSATESAA